MVDDSTAAAAANSHSHSTRRIVNQTSSILHRLATGRVSKDSCGHCASCQRRASSSPTRWSHQVGRLTCFEAGGAVMFCTPQPPRERASGRLSKYAALLHRRFLASSSASCATIFGKMYCHRREDVRNMINQKYHDHQLTLPSTLFHTTAKHVETHNLTHL